MAKNKKIVFCGGQQNFVNMLRNAQPDISYVDQCNLATCDALIANSDIVIFRVTQMSHSLYGKAKQICKARGIRFEHLPNVTSIDSHDFRKNQGRFQNILFYLYGWRFCYDARKHRASH